MRRCKADLIEMFWLPQEIFLLPKQNHLRGSPQVELSSEDIPLSLRHLK